MAFSGGGVNTFSGRRIVFVFSGSKIVTFSRGRSVTFIGDMIVSFSGGRIVTSVNSMNVTVVDSYLPEYKI